LWLTLAFNDRTPTYQRAACATTVNSAQDARPLHGQNGSLQRVVRPPTHRTRLSRSAIRVCQPAPVERHRAMTSAGSRMVISCLGLADMGRPAFFNAAPASICSVSSGSSRYSCGFVTCASTRRRFDFKVRRCALRFTGISFPHAKNVLIVPSRGIADNHQSTRKMSVTDHPRLAT
jgi:hypothetical protein